MVVIRNKAAALLIFHQLLSTQLALAGISCSTDDDCKSKLELLTPGVSVCEEGECTNPFEQGCLKAMGEVYGKKNIRIPAAFDQVRICNSDDDVIPGNKDWCRQPTWAEVLTYDEVRMAPANWESAIFNSWIYQILLTELLEVPATLEHGDGKRGAGSFYDRNNELHSVDSEHANEISHEVLLEADRLDGDCSKSEVPCAHVIPEVWMDGTDDNKAQEGVLPATTNGMINRLGFYIPSYTAINHPELASIHGLSDEKNREKILSVFLTPTTWKEYCALNSCSNSATSTEPRPPSNEEEENKYFVAGEYNGYFRDMTEMGIDCVNDSENCIGHFVNFDNSNCNWASYAEAQLKWNDISLMSRGPAKSNNGYSYNAMKEIWEAAQATKSNVIMWWWYPDPTIEFYEKTDYKFHRINFPTPTEECINYRHENLNYCSVNQTERLGDNALASCDYPVERPQKYLSRVLKTHHDDSPEALRSPAYTVMSEFKIPTYAIEEMYEEWVKIGMAGYNSRETVCKWVYDNIEMLELYVPTNYPRKVNENRNITSIYAAYSLAVMAVLLVVLVAVFTYKLRERRAMRFAQVGFLIWVIIGLGFVSIGAITGTEAISHGTCVIAEWSVLIGYTLEVAPILIKVQAINKLTRSSMQFRRIKIDVKKLKKYPFFFVTPVILYLIVWTVVDTPKATNTFILNKTGTGNIIEMNKSCSSGSEVWSIMAYLWQGLLLLSASVLAFQSRDVSEEMNESQKIGFLVYSHFMFLILRIVIRALSSNGRILGSLASSLVSIILSVDVLAALVIYFGPKFYNIATEDSNKQSTRTLNRGGAKNPGGNTSILEKSGERKVQRSSEYGSRRSDASGKSLSGFQGGIDQNGITKEEKVPLNRISADLFPVKMKNDDSEISSPGFVRGLDQNQITEEEKVPLDRTSVDLSPVKEKSDDSEISSPCFEGGKDQNQITEEENLPLDCTSVDLSPGKEKSDDSGISSPGFEGDINQNQITEEENPPLGGASADIMKSNI